MSIDIFQSRRTYFEECKWWSRDESDDITNDELIYKRAPKGIFFAKEVSAESDRMNIVGSNFMFDREDVTIRTPDDVSEIKANDVVLYQDEPWLVVSVQKEHLRQSHQQFAADRNVSHHYVLQLRK